jgi:hypothetical protein
MAMKETVGSLRAYLILAGGLSFMFGAQPMFKSGVPLLVVLGGIQTVLSLGFIVCGFLITKLLAESPGVIKAVILANVAYSLALYFVLAQMVGAYQAGQQVWSVVIGVAIGWYLYTNTTRLAKELQPPITDAKVDEVPAP